ncbi:MAG TPA: MlaD family protein [Streptosporangiaceae bacterium]|jgi:phospholipid/cholesterol/gamma-HCH transport system substrate-binding protein|nr:MlaD family protein [Streptosporangiaceae bacterium]
MRSRWNLPIFLAYVAASLAVLGYLFMHMGGEFVFRSSYQVAADFTTASNLVPGDDVTVSGVPVGRVASVQLVQGGARVHMQLSQQYAPLYQDARAMIKVKNLLDESYVELYRGATSSGPLPAGGTIPSSRTLTPVELAQVLDVLTPDTRQQLTSVINNLGESVAGQGQNLNAAADTLKVTSQALDGISHALADQQVNLGSLITSLSKVLATLAAWHQQLKALVGDWDGVMRALAQHEQQLQGLVVNENQVMTILDQALAGNSTALHTAIQESPQLINSANTYTANGGIIFGQVSQQVTSIDELFYELASVFSATDSQGHHYWRVYPVSGGLGTVGLPLIPSPSTKKGKP